MKNAHETLAMRELMDAADLFARENKTSLVLLCQTEANNPTIEGITKIMHRAGECKASFRLINALTAIKPKSIGRPEVGDAVLPALTIPKHIKDLLKKKADELGISLPELRREAYKKLFEKL